MVGKRNEGRASELSTASGRGASLGWGRRVIETSGEIYGRRLAEGGTAGIVAEFPFPHE